VNVRVTDVYWTATIGCAPMATINPALLMPMADVGTTPELAGIKAFRSCIRVLLDQWNARGAHARCRRANHISIVVEVQCIAKISSQGTARKVPRLVMPAFLVHRKSVIPLGPLEYQRASCMLGICAQESCVGL
jgi:hypothetical protein